MLGCHVVKRELCCEGWVVLWQPVAGRVIQQLIAPNTALDCLSHLKGNRVATNGVEDHDSASEEELGRSVQVALDGLHA